LEVVCGRCSIGKNREMFEEEKWKKEHVRW